MEAASLRQIHVRQSSSTVLTLHFTGVNCTSRGFDRSVHKDGCARAARRRLNPTSVPRRASIAFRVSSGIEYDRCHIVVACRLAWAEGSIWASSRNPSSSASNDVHFAIVCASSYSYPSSSTTHSLPGVYSELAFLSKRQHFPNS